MMSSKTHAGIDYAVGVLLVLAPYLPGFANGGPQHLLPVTLGAVTIG